VGLGNTKVGQKNKRNAPMDACSIHSKASYSYFCGVDSDKLDKVVASESDGEPNKNENGAKAELHLRGRKNKQVLTKNQNRQLNSIPRTNST